ncbi:NAD(P)-binding domain-containing protein [Amycolatopsis thermophila]|uniref:Pyrroline-5-carboxylate reductase n=1 Tax=Amycolatopsis thermophila TaxID=206084 RepID=A0ABU0F190_9PSEU|nr:NAD(P)-binding domain-containing protein [Amycolatopsis thermophila]MDQ0381114.1 pyrroline-5-carboxylate reductase [Amycolatopsis thermophila]
MTAYGFVGAGEISAAVVEGLSAGVAQPPAVFLSPRGREVGRSLAGRFPNVRVCASNQEVLDRADVVVLAVRVPVAREVAQELSFRPEHVVISAIAGVPLSSLREWTAPAGEVVRSIPLPQAARRQSLTVMYPESEVARALFTRVGRVLVPASESALESFTGATAAFSAHLDYLATIVDWLTGHGVDRESATAFVTHVFGRLGESLLERPDALDVMTSKHTTPGGLNEQFRADLREAGVPDAVRHALDRILERVRG